MKEKKLTKRQERALETRDKIFETAFRLMEEKGFDNITVSEICKVSGVAKGSFYTYFKSKDDIVIEVYKDVDEKYSSEVKSLPEGTPAFDKILAAVGFQAAYAVARGLKFTTQIYKSQLESGTDFFISEERPFFKIIKESIDEGILRKELSPHINSAETARWIVTLSRGITYDWCLHHGNYDIEQTMKKVFKLVHKGLQALNNDFLSE